MKVKINYDESRAFTILRVVRQGRVLSYLTYMQNGRLESISGRKSTNLRLAGHKTLIASSKEEFVTILKLRVVYGLKSDLNKTKVMVN